jgi:hypothetical protein
MIPGMDDSKWSWFGILRVVPITPGVATGAASIGRDFLFLTDRTPEPHTAFWAWLRVSWAIAFSIAWLQEHRRVKSTELKLKPKLRILSKVHEQTWMHELGRAYAYYIEIVNDGEAGTVENVNVRLDQIEPEVSNLNWLPVHLHLKHDNRPINSSNFVNRTEFDLHAGDRRQVDLVSAVVNSPTITVEHIVQGVNASVPPGRYKFTVIAVGRNVPRLPAPSRYSLTKQRF